MLNKLLIVEERYTRQGGLMLAVTLVGRVSSKK